MSLATVLNDNEWTELSSASSFPATCPSSPYTSGLPAISDLINMKLNELCYLHKGWDGHKGIPVKFDNAMFAREIISVIPELYQENISLVPIPDGKIQIEWHTLYGDIELLVCAPFEVEGTYTPVAGPNDEIEERQLKSDFQQVVKWLEEIHPHQFQRIT